MKQFAVIGLGRFGANVAKGLAERGYDVLAIDYNEEKVNAIANLVTHAVQLDAMEEEALKALGLRNFDTVIVAIGEHDIQANILVTVMLKEMGVKQVIARAQSSLHGKVLLKIGADKIIYPEEDMGIRLAHNIVTKNILDFLELSPEYSILEMITPEAFLGKNLRELNLVKRFGISVVAVKRGTDIIVMPEASLELMERDVLVAIGDRNALSKLQQVR